MRAWRCLVIAAVLLVSGCATGSVEPPAGTPKVATKFPAQGTKWRTHATGTDGSDTTYTLTALGDDTHEGKPVFKVSDGVDIYVFDKATHSWIANLRDGKERFSASPHDGSGSTELWVGKSWMASYTYYDRERGRSFSNVTYWWKVTAFKDATVPAGTFKAFKIEGSNPYSSFVTWYAPDLGVTVKRIYERNAGNYLGYGKFTTELIEFPAK